MVKNAIYEATREVRTFADLAHGAGVLIGKAHADNEGSYYTVMSSLLMCAFTLEAYLNHVGDKSLKFWSEVEPMRVKDKYSLLCKHFDITPDFGKRPYQTFNELFKFRNAIAHGKSVILKETKEVTLKDSLEVGNTPKAHWEEYCELVNAERAKEDVVAIIKELHGAAGLGDYPFMFGDSSGSITLKSALPGGGP